MSQDMFSSDIFEYDDPNTHSEPVLRLRSPWKFSATIAAEEAQAAAETAQSAAGAASAAASAAQSSANNALLQLAEIASDDILSASEKPAILLDVSTILNEQSGIDTQATNYGITTEKSSYDSAITSLSNYLATLTSPTLWSDITGNTTIVGTTFRSYFSAVYSSRQNLLNKITEEAKSLIVTAQQSADSALSQLEDIASDDILSPSEKPTVILDVETITTEQSGIDTQADNYGITTEKNSYDSAITALTNYLATLTSPTLWNSLSGNTAIVGGTFRSYFSAVYSARQVLFNKLYETSNKLVKTWTQSSAPTIGSRPNAINGDIWYDSDDGSKYEAISGAWVLQTSSVPLDPAAYYSFDEVPEIPDDPAGVTYLSIDNWTSGFDNWSVRNTSTMSLSILSGRLVAIRTAPDSIYSLGVQRPISGIANSIIRFKVVSKLASVPTASIRILYRKTSDNTIISKNLDDYGNTLMGTIIPDAFNQIIIYAYDPGSGSIGDYISIGKVYIGTGAYLPGSPLDNSGHGNHGTVHGATPVQGISGNGLSFNGLESTYVSIPLNKTFIAYTFSFWQDQRAEKMALGSSNNKFYKYGERSWFDPISEWYHGVDSYMTGRYLFTVTWNGAVQKIYVNGVLRATRDHSGTCTFNANLLLGKHGDVGFAYTGLFDEFAIYDRALSDQEVLGLYKSKSLPTVYSRAQFLADQAISDNAISPTEKKTIYSLWYAINGDGASTGSYWVARNRAIALALTGSTEYSALNTAYSNLNSYLYTTPGVLAASSWRSTITIISATYQALWSAYYAAETAMVNKISNQEGVNAISTSGANVHTLAPKYLGIGILQASGTAPFPGASVAQDGTITTTSTVNPNAGDWMVNYATTYQPLGIYYWSGSAWTATTDYKYISDAAIDLCYLEVGGITISGFTTFITAIIKTLFVQTLTLLSGGTIASNNYVADTSGFKLTGDTGLIEAISATFKNCTISGAFTKATNTVILSSSTKNAVFDALSIYIPNVGDRRQCSGGIATDSGETSGIVVSFIERTSSTLITAYGSYLLVSSGRFLPTSTISIQDASSAYMSCTLCIM